ncbi:TPA: hypothetical protein I7221_10400 [Vibrio vulnificus]|nr:hypothetical protein [Vibrio vulnificus]HAS6173420.1 hypothetical protein [Vibrio vulnificus]HAS8443138.1 hypothetical protein [Vibrio vulnificus]HAT8556400.1 hypothetical protein [Vibrio vulnificus]HAU8251733.1 hypothetical protein [Vibrio vulnificus]
MQKVKYPFALDGVVSIKFNKYIKCMFFETDDNNNYEISLDDFVVKQFTYDSECRLLVVSLHKSFPLINASEHEALSCGVEFELSSIKIDLVYCLYKASVISYEMNTSLTQNDLVSSVELSRPLKMRLH